MSIEDKVLTVNNKDYIVIETVQFEGRIYAYLVNNANVSDSIFKEIVVDNDMKLLSIEKTLFSEKIYPLFLEKFKNYWYLYKRFLNKKEITTIFLFCLINEY